MSIKVTIKTLRESILTKPSNRNPAHVDVFSVAIC